MNKHTLHENVHAIHSHKDKKMKKTILDKIRVTAFENLKDDERKIFTHAQTDWLNKHLGDTVGADLCGRGAVIVYNDLLENRDEDEKGGAEKLASKTDEEKMAEFIKSCVHVCGAAVCDYVKHYRQCLSRRKT